MKAKLLKNIETPCVVIDEEIVRKNIIAMQMMADSYNCKLRPHIKTHKMKHFAKMQLEAGASGITCAKISEAEIMAEICDDIFIAYPLVGNFRVERAINLSKKIERLILAVDSIDGAIALNKAAEESKICLEIRLEVDTGAGRTGVIRDNLHKTAQRIKELKNLNLTGIYTFKSLVYRGEKTRDREVAGAEEGRLMGEIAKELIDNGIDIIDISAGSTPTAESVTKTGIINEVRPGTYIFNDYMLHKQGVAVMEDMAVAIYTTVVSTPREDYAVIDGGSKTFSTDIALNEPPYYFNSYAKSLDRDDLIIYRMNEEHGMVKSLSGKTNLKVGDKLSFLPLHVCTSINLHNHVYILRDTELLKEKVDARGMLV